MMMLLKQFVKHVLDFFVGLLNMSLDHIDVINYTLYRFAPLGFQDRRIGTLLPFLIVGLHPPLTTLV